jgi:hypothetical protein
MEHRAASQYFRKDGPCKFLNPSTDGWGVAKRDPSGPDFIQNASGDFRAPVRFYNIASTSSACSSGFTFGQIFLMRSSGPIERMGVSREHPA